MQSRASCSKFFIFNMLKSIKKLSPNLHGALKRFVNMDDADLMDYCFETAIHHQGLEEIDFKREDGVSYNPRPARVALILINDAKILDPQLISTSFLANIEKNKLVNLKNEENKIPKEFFQNALLAKSPFFYENLRKEIKIISLALQLDRARHRHLSPRLNNKENWQEFLEENLKYIKLAKDLSPQLHLLLEEWQERAMRKIC